MASCLRVARPFAAVDLDRQQQSQANNAAPLPDSASAREPGSGEPNMWPPGDGEGGGGDGIGGSGGGSGGGGGGDSEGGGSGGEDVFGITGIAPAGITRVSANAENASGTLRLESRTRCGFSPCDS